MLTPPFPANEIERVEALRRLRVLDTPPEERFDLITHLATTAFNVPIALVSLVDSDRQWFKSLQGLTVRETPRSLSFCGHALFSDEILLVPDALQDERFHDNTLVTGNPGIRFYAGCPVHTPEGHVVGTLCLIDRKPRSLTKEEHQLLRGMASWVESELNLAELRRAYFASSENEMRLAESETRFRQAFEFAPIGIALASPTGQWLKANPALCDLVGYSEGELLRKSFQDITHPDDLDSDLVHLQELLTGKRSVYAIEKRYLHRLGHTVWVSLSASLVRNLAGEPQYFISQIEDITERRRLEQVKTDFLANAAHELRSPMSSILGFSELLLKRSYSDERRAELLGIINGQAVQLTNLINELLDLARIEAGAGRDFSIVRQSIVPIIEGTLAAFLVPPGREQVQLELTGELPELAVDAEKLRQTLTNLLSNAYKYSPDGGPVILTARIEGDHVAISVRDQGLGMTKEETARVFERFFRGTDSRSIRGSGLGLSIVKEIVELHGGQIGLESEPGRGTTVTLFLPIGN